LGYRCCAVLNCYAPVVKGSPYCKNHTVDDAYAKVPVLIQHKYLKEADEDGFVLNLVLQNNHGKLVLLPTEASPWQTKL